jgi:hypothetical protein
MVAKKVTQALGIDTSGEVLVPAGVKRQGPALPAGGCSRTGALTVPRKLSYEFTNRLFNFRNVTC